jgi:hypothetical protein
MMIVNMPLVRLAMREGVGGYKSRGRRPNFEYIIACGKNGFFTSALVWSLNKLHDDAPFTSEALVKKTWEYPHLPKDQKPELRHKEILRELLWIAPIGTNLNLDDAANSAHRDLDHEFLDLRLSYYRAVSVDDAE